MFLHTRIGDISPLTIFITAPIQENRRSGLTHCLRQAVDPLVVGVRLVPDEGVGQVRFCGEPLLEEPSHHAHHQVHLHQVEGDGGLGHGDLQDGPVASGPRAQIHQVQVAAGDGRLLLKHLHIKGGQELQQLVELGGHQGQEEILHRSFLKVSRLIGL